jgi:molecular chaperone GrpE
VSERGPEEQDRVIIRDNRKIDPVTGEARKASPDPAGPAAGQPGPAAEPATEAAEGPKVDATLLDERTRDLQRVQAEYANYRKRMDREVEAADQRGVGRALTALLPILDDWQRARDHGDVTGPIASILEKQERTLEGLGLERVGEEGDPFDPTLHEAVLHDESDAVSVPTCTKILRPGYRHGERLLRAAMVAVSDPASPAASPAASSQAASAADGAGDAASQPEPQPESQSAPQPEAEPRHPVE